MGDLFSDFANGSGIETDVNIRQAWQDCNTRWYINTLAGINEDLEGPVDVCGPRPEGELPDPNPRLVNTLHKMLDIGTVVE